MGAVGRFARVCIDAEEWTMKRLSALATHLGRRSSLPEHLITGIAGEQAAYFELRRRGYQIVAQRWTNKQLSGDVDLIGWDGEWLCFIEVKSRTKRDNTPAQTAIDDAKRQMLRSMARAYLRTFAEAERPTIPVRFDIVAVYLLK